MKIIRIRWENYKGLADGAIDADGTDVSVFGRNGAGKSSIASVLPFVLFGKGSGSVKHYDDGLIPGKDNLTHAAEIDFADGTTLRREYFWANGGNRQSLYINGRPKSLAAFNAFVANFTRDGGELVFNPFAFCRLKPKDQRDLLTKIFGTVSESSLLDAPKFAEVKNFLGGQSVEQFIAQTKTDIKNAKITADEFPVRIEELQLQLPTGFDIDARLQELEAALTARRSERNKLSAKSQQNFSIELAQAQRRQGDLVRQADYQTRQLESLRARREELLAQYHHVAGSKPGICPTCGQSMPIDAFKAKRDALLADIKRNGQQCAADILGCQNTLAEIFSEQHEVTNRIAALEAERPQDFSARLESLDAQINSLTQEVAQLQPARKTIARIEKLRTDERNLNEQIAQLQVQLKAAENFRQCVIESVEADINRHFEHVKFKLFDYLVTTGEARPTCEATLHGVPYVALSRGEQLKAALDIFKTLQAHFGVEMPLFIDDAESYTANSLVELPNQLWLFKVSDGDLTIEISTEHRAA